MTLNEKLSSIFVRLGFTPRKAAQPLQGMELQEKHEDTNQKHIGKLIRKQKQRQNVPVYSRFKTI